MIIILPALAHIRENETWITPSKQIYYVEITCLWVLNNLSESLA